MNEAVRSNFVEISMTIWNALAVFIIIVEASKMFTQNLIHVQRMKEFLMESRLAREELHQSPVKQRSTSLLPTININAHVEDSWWLGISGDNDGDNDDGCSKSGLTNFCRCVESMIVYCEQYNSPARVLGVAITPLLVTTTIAYLASFGLTLVFTLMKDNFV